MNIHIFSDKAEMGREAAKKAAEILLESIEKNGSARFVLATGVSQFDFLKNFVTLDIPWNKTELFHLDEYIGISSEHSASFCRYLKERFVNIVKHPHVNLIQGEAQDVKKECERLSDLIKKKPVDLAIIGIGENGHIAFNDPPADFDIEIPYIIVKLDDLCRNQQIREGWFQNIEEVPTHAISMSVKQILKAKHIICICPDARKRRAIYDTLHPDMPVTPNVPASILKTHGKIDFYLDEDSAKSLFYEERAAMKN
jgi:glucosamine-6-phosphate deaminase